MAKLRIIVSETDSGAACNIGGPVHVSYKTFDVEAPAGMAEWIREPRDKKWSFFTRDIVGVELLDPTPALSNPEGETL